MCIPLVPLPYLIAQSTIIDYLKLSRLVRCQLDIVVVPLHLSIHVTASLIFCLNIYDQVFVLRPSCVPEKVGVKQKRRK
jgi:hypothetical protein